MKASGSKTRAGRVACSLLATALLALAAAAPSSAGTANIGLPGASSTNPLVAPAMPWGLFYSPTREPGVDPPSAYFNTSRDHAVRNDMAKVLLTSRFRWFGSWINLKDQGYRQTYKPGVYNTVLNYVAGVRSYTGNPNALVPVGIFRLEPYESHVADYIPSAKQVAGYKAWIREFVRGLRDSNARTVLLLQPDLPIAVDKPYGSKVSDATFAKISKLDLGLVRWSAQQFSALPYTTVYIDAGASDWVPVGKIASALRAAGVQYARGFSLNVTHYESNGNNIAYGKQIVRDLASHGMPGKHFVVATGMNGRPFNFQRVSRAYRKNPPVCATPRATKCVAIGAPPTTQTGDAAADAFLWTSRPWINNATRRSLGEFLKIIRNSPFYKLYPDVPGV